LKRFLRFLRSLITGLKPGVNERKTLRLLRQSFAGIINIAFPVVSADSDHRLLSLQPFELVGSARVFTCSQNVGVSIAVQWSSVKGQGQKRAHAIQLCCKFALESTIARR